MATAILTDFDLHLLREGRHFRTYQKLGAQAGAEGVSFAVWAPNAAEVSLIGEFNGWNTASNVMRGRGGLWEVFVPGLAAGAAYKFCIVSGDGRELHRTDPYAYSIDRNMAARVCEPDVYEWGDSEWMAERRLRNAIAAPLSFYEVHLGSWRQVPEEGDRPLTYRELAGILPEYVHDMGFTHLALLPVSEHGPDSPWGYEPFGFFAPASRFGTPHDFMLLVDSLHRAGAGVVIDWVPSRFSAADGGLAKFDGTPLFEPADPRQARYPTGGLRFDLARPEARSFLISNALFWLDKYHIDGLRVDGLASMLYGEEGDNAPAVNFLRLMNETVSRAYHDTTTIAGEAVAWPMTSRPTYAGGLGFALKWNDAWKSDTLAYVSRDPLERSRNHNLLTGSLSYAFGENYVLAYSHADSMPGPGSLISRIPGDDWRKFATLRTLYGYMLGHPGKKLLFMGDEFGQWREWNHETSLDWRLLSEPYHAGLQRWVRDLNTFHRGEPSLYELDFDPAGFEWIDSSDFERSVVSFLRRRRDGSDPIVFV